ncbi:hypothetical protein C8F04DRAFT_1202426 [Mycena alexandri]|uniref:Uncharacterized protein n=1 Tax=Mycena alexandri TaxID=1745969 RepID=A0AAD6RW08_9AGAR|nr:hypothetical protein C8F04DRAFT_1202426 [Mycena alexandri]
MRRFGKPAHLFAADGQLYGGIPGDAEMLRKKGKTPKKSEIERKCARKRGAEVHVAVVVVAGHTGGFMWSMALWGIAAGGGGITRAGAEMVVVGEQEVFQTPTAARPLLRKFQTLGNLVNSERFRGILNFKNYHSVNGGPGQISADRGRIVADAARYGQTGFSLGLNSRV